MAAPSASLRFLHLAPGDPPLDVYVGDALVLPGLRYGQLSDYRELPPERHRIRCYPAGSAGWESIALDIELEKLRPRFDYTLALVDRIPDLQPLLLEDTAQAPGREHASVRFLHASPDAPALDIRTGGGRVLFTLVPFARITPFTEIEAGTYDLEARRSSHPSVLASLRGYVLAGEHFYTFVAHGLVDGEPPFGVMPIEMPVRRCVPVP
ncbi:MAG: DUF4397 domain-containing protein [Anaerolineae bacterium]|nr:DUF4397 domain-containing protein [Anaerolineae bacterium]